MHHLGCRALEDEALKAERKNKASEAEPGRTVKEPCHADVCTFLDALTIIEVRTVHAINCSSNRCK